MNPMIINLGDNFSLLDPGIDASDNYDLSLTITIETNLNEKVKAIFSKRI